MNDDYKNNTSNNNDTSREFIGSANGNDIMDARKKKVQSFKLNINDSWLNDDVPDKSATPSTIPNTATETPVQEKPKAKPRKTEEERELEAFNKAARDYDEGNFLLENSDAEESKNATPEITGDLNSYSGEEQKQRMDKEEREALKSYKKSEKRRRKQKAEKNGCMFRAIWLTMILIISIVLGNFIWTEFSDLLGQSRSEDVHSVAIQVPENATLDDVVQILIDNELIKEPDFFKLYAKVTKSDSDYMTGIHNMDSNMDYEAILNSLQSGRELKETVQIQFKEGLSVRECAQILEDKKVCTAAQFMDACNSDEFDDEFDFVKDIKPNDKRVYKLEGYLFPDTYDFYIGENASDAVRRFLNNFQQKCYEEKQTYDGYTGELPVAELAEKKDMTVDEIINMASLVQAEAANEKDMYVISSIFYNRLDTDAYDGVNAYGDGELNKMKSDATLYYPYASEDDIPQEIRATFKSNYNTYNITCLPPGAICNPGLKAIDAAVNPDSTDYYYFCHKAATTNEAAEAFYATTYDQHLINMEEAGLSTD
ncbi:MAG TPA: endolytic transglycosylase MltG [Clostridiales bacterium]|nr:endolytic transglycosylase MltG [Clostridiales bacterium]